MKTRLRRTPLTVLVSADLLLTMSLLFVLNATVEAGPAPQVAQSLPPELLKLNVDNFGPGIREQVKKSLAEARRNPRDANVVGRLGMILQTYEDYELAAACYTLAREPYERALAAFERDTHLVDAVDVCPVA